MKIEKPSFKLNEYCPNCGQGRSLTFLVCSNCDNLVLACDEEGSLFPNPKDLSQSAEWPCDVWQSTYTKCPHCNNEGELKLATGSEIQNYGFTPSQYS